MLAETDLKTRLRQHIQEQMRHVMIEAMTAYQLVDNDDAIVASVERTAELLHEALDAVEEWAGVAETDG
jgi:hypothetical protein